ncbi:DNA-binding response regulator [Modicisalibacter tunisiensis]|uniref:helix-turn-helix transcriptional regulator n=1 Tax=Modicisalibacter tunisiensis TaxID=390637 RepID=UPI001CC911C9|nr:DNA-binding response regulator [Modicisalibacter tunisiensis]MBZ9539067.1 DNA-binding response regulator [Modicisalibacter tunisiensis]
MGHVLVVVRDINESPASDYVAALKAGGYSVRFIPVGTDPVPSMQREPPSVACFQFDYPDAQGLSDLRRARQQLPAVPLLMITQAHSESLAVWAFRTRVWDYFTMPVDTVRLLSVVEALQNQGSVDTKTRQALESTNAIPPDARQRYTGNPEEKSIIERALTHVDANLHNKIVQSEVAELFGLSPFQFSRLFRRMTKMTFQEYLLSRRIEEAKRLLVNSRTSVTDVCFTVGFRDLSYFTRIFQRYVGMPPSRYRQVIRENTPVVAPTTVVSPETEAELRPQ